MEINSPTMTDLESTLVNLALEQLATVACILDANTTDLLADEYLQSTTLLNALIKLGHLEGSGMGAEAVESIIWLETQYTDALHAAEVGEPVIKRDRSKLN